MSNEERAQVILEQSVGDGARFREGQLDSILACLDGGRHLVVQATGWGKSTVYFTAAKMLAEQGRGRTLVVSPLLALTRDQLRNAEARFGLNAKALNSTNYDDHEAILESWSKGEVEVLFITPERLAKPSEFAKILGIEGGIGMLVIDEAHCISDWGHDFRPDFRRIVDFLDQLDDTVTVLCTTATANARVVNDIHEQVGTLSEVRGPLARRSLHVDVIQLPSHAERLAWLTRNVEKLPGSGIIYALTQRDTLVIADWLRSKDIMAAAYHGSMEDDDREKVERALLNNRLKAVVATCALGMGFDKPDLGFVIHFQRPASIVEYYQQIGRAGRAIPEARCVLLCGAEDGEIHASLRRSSFPREDHLRRIVRVLDDADEGLTYRVVQLKTDITKQRLTHALKHLTIDGAVEEVFEPQRRLIRTVNPWEPDVAKIEEIIAVREQEWEVLQKVVGGELCVLRGAREALSDPHVEESCGQCSTCRDLDFESEIPANDVAEAQQFYMDRSIIIIPRKQWMELDGKRPSITPEERCEQGRALCKYMDAGWGHMVRDAKYDAHHFDDSLLQGAVDLIRNRWEECTGITHVAFVPGRDSNGPVGDFAARLAGALGLPLIALLHRRDTGRAQKDQDTSEYQLAHARQAYELVADVPDEARVLLFDDLVDSRWTFTVAGALLRQAGAAAVFPFALADAGGHA